MSTVGYHLEHETQPSKVMYLDSRDGNVVDTRHLVETLYRILGEPEPPSKKKIRVGYGCRYEQVWMTSDDMLERIIKVLKQ